MIAFSAPMAPMGKARPRFGRGRVFMPAPYRAWQRRFRSFIPRGTITGPVAVRIVIATKTGRSRSDVDNSAGSVLDSLQPDTIANDRDVVDLHVRLVQSRQPEIRVEVESLQGVAWAA